MKNNKHPDVMLYHSYGSEHKIHVHIVTFETEDFSSGLELVDTFAGPDAEKNAEDFAVKVQQYVDLLKGVKL